MARKNYTGSKFLLTYASIVAFSGISVLVSIRGPFGSSAAATPATTTQAVTQSQQASSQAVASSDRRALVLQDNSSSATSIPVARSRGS